MEMFKTKSKYTYSVRTTTRQNRRLLKMKNITLHVSVKNLKETSTKSFTYSFFFLFNGGLEQEVETRLVLTSPKHSRRTADLKKYEPIT